MIRHKKILEISYFAAIENDRGLPMLEEIVVQLDPSCESTDGSTSDGTERPGQA
jgi:hypothetical protein